MITATPEVERQLLLIDELDLEPVAFKLVHPEPGESGMSIEKADELIVKYRRFLKLCVMYPSKGIVPSKDIDPVWHNHILDTAKYAADCEAVFGFMLHHFPYLGLRGEQDVADWKNRFRETMTLYEQHFGEPMVGNSISASAACDSGDGTGGDDAGGLCDGGACDSAACSPTDTMLNRERPRLVRV